MNKADRSKMFELEMRVSGLQSSLIALEELNNNIMSQLVKSKSLVAELKSAGDIMFERLATLSAFGVKTPDGVTEAMSLWAYHTNRADNPHE